jgi:pimeloyl-ACP methyl ester carboxylesterase
MSTSERADIAESWRSKGERRSIFGRELFFVTEGPADAPPLLILHGFPSSSLDFHQALPRLAERHRVVVHDHLGFGFSDKPEGAPRGDDRPLWSARGRASAVPEGYSYSLLEQAEMAIGLWRSLGITRGHLLAHDYGTSVATELLARRARGMLPIAIESVTLCNGSVHIDLAHLTPSQRLLKSAALGPLFARLANRRVFMAQLRKILGDPRSVPEAELDAMWTCLTRDGGSARLPSTSAYMDERVRFRSRWIGALASLDVPAHVLWGRRDPVAVPAIAEALAAEIPGAKVTWLEALGHYPMLEDPGGWASAALAFLDAVAR